MFGVNNLVTTILVDTSNFVIKAIRHSSLPYRFIKEAGEYWKSNLKSSKNDYNYWYNTDPTSKSIKQLWKEAQDVGYLGENMTEEEMEEIKQLKNST